MNLPRLSFYLATAVLCLAVATAWHWQEALRFVEVPQLWWEPVLAGALTGWLAALLGLYLILNRIVFLGLAVSQGSGLGIFSSFLIAGALGWGLEGTIWPLMTGIAFATATAGLFAWTRGRGHTSEEAITGLIYVIAAGLTIMMGDRLSQGHHAIDDFLLGNAVAVLHSDLLNIAIAAVVISVLHFGFRNFFIYCSSDEEFMRSRGVGAQRWLGLLYLTLTIGITFAVKTLGLVPVFALLLIPAFIGLKGARNMSDAFGIALLLGFICPPLGYYFSFLFSFPTGATLICTCGVFLLASFMEQKILRM